MDSDAVFWMLDTPKNKSIINAVSNNSSCITDYLLNFEGTNFRGNKLQENATGENYVS